MEIRSASNILLLHVRFHLPFWKEMSCHSPPPCWASTDHATGHLGFIRNQYARLVAIPLVDNPLIGVLTRHYSYLNSKILPWDPKEKRKELFHSKSRFILVRPIDPTGPLLAFSMFRFEDEEDEDAIYWWTFITDIHICRLTQNYSYELQVTASRQGMGLGKRLINELVTLGRAFNMEKILLTVFKGLHPFLDMC